MNKILKQFKSKRNKVYLVENNGLLSVMKVHESKEKAELEASILESLANTLNVPKVLRLTDNVLYTEYIDGTAFLEYFLSSDKNISKASNMLFDFCSKYAYVMAPYALLDTNFNNFIITKDIKLYGIDFEDKETGTILNSAANIVAFAFLYDADIENKKELYNVISGKEGINKEALNIEILKSLDMLIKRRHLSVSAQSTFDFFA